MDGQGVEEIEGLKLEAEGMDDIPGTAVIYCSGYIDVPNSGGFSDFVMGVIEKGFTHLAIDMSQIHYMSSAGMGSLAVILGATKARGGALVISGMTPTVLGMLTLLGVGEFFNRTDTVEEALSFFPGPPPPPNIPYTKMESIASLCDDLRKYVPKAERQAFYSDLYRLLAYIKEVGD